MVVKEILVCQMRWLRPVIPPALWEAKKGDHLKLRVQDQLEQHETLSLLKKVKLAKHGGGHREGNITHWGL